MNITHRQIRMASALLEMEQAELAKALDVSAMAVSNIMRGDTKSGKAYSRIINYFESKGVKFTENEGVERYTIPVKKLNGTEGFKELLDNIYVCAQKENGDFFLVNGNLDIYLRPEIRKFWQNIHIPRMMKFKNNLNFKVLSPEGYKSYKMADYCEYRWSNLDFFKEEAVYVYGSTLAFVSTAYDIDILLIQSKTIAESYKGLFNMAWENAYEEPDYAY